MSRENCQGYFVCLHLTYAISPLSIMLLLLEPQQIYTSNEVVCHQRHKLTGKEGWKISFTLFTLINAAGCKLQSQIKCCSEMPLLQISLKYHGIILRLYSSPCIIPGSWQVKECYVMLMLCWTFAFIL